MGNLFSDFVDSLEGGGWKESVASPFEQLFDIVKNPGDVWDNLGDAWEHFWTPPVNVPALDLGQQSSSVLLNKQSNIAPIPIIYGQRKVGGIIVFKDVSGSSNEYLHIVMVLCEGEIEEIGDVYLNDIISTDTKYSGLVTITKYTGTTSQSADSGLIADFPSKWTSAHQLKGLAYIVCKLKWSREAFGRQPTIHCIVKGKKVYDPRDTTTVYSTNPALIIRDYLTNTIYGRGLPTSAIDDDAIETAANYCDTMQQKHTGSAIESGTAEGGSSDTGTNLGTLNDIDKSWTTNEYQNDAILITAGTGSGQFRKIISNTSTQIVVTPTWTTTVDNTSQYEIYSEDITEKTFECNAVLNTDIELLENLSELKKTCRGSLPYIQGKYTLIIEKADSSVMSFDEDNIIGTEDFIVVGPKKTNKYNTMKVQYVNPDFNWQVDEAIVSSATYLAADNNYVLDGTYSMPLETSRSRALHKAETLLKTSRSNIIVQFLAMIEALELIPGNIIDISQTELGWSSKLFRVIDIDLLMDGNVRVGAIEYDSNDYDRTVNAEYTPPSDTTLPDPFTVQPPTGFSVDSSETYVINQNGTLITRARLTWTPSLDEYVIYYNCEFKKTSDSTWLTGAIGAGKDANEAFITALEDGISYDFRVIAVNNQNARSNAAQQLGHTIIGKTTPPADVQTLTISRQSDGTREYTWTYTNPIDMSHFLFRYVSGTGGAWSGMSAIPGMEEIPKGVRKWESNQLGAGTYTIGIKAVDLSGIESTNAKLVEVTLGSQRLGTALSSEDAPGLSWPGTLTDMRLEDDNILYAANTETWADLTSGWSALTAGWTTSPDISSVIYTHQVQDAGSVTDVIPELLYTTNATTITIEERHGNTATPDGSWSAWATITGSSFNARYFQTRITLSITSGLIQLSAYRSTGYQA